MSANRKRLYTLLRVGHTHLSSHAAGWDEDTYRDLLQRHGATEKGGKISATTMTIPDMETALSEMRGMGFKPKSKKKTNRKPDTRDRRIAKLNAMWCAMYREGIVRDRSERAMKHWVESQVAGVTRFEWITGEQLNKAVEMMKGMAKGNGLRLPA